MLLVERGQTEPSRPLEPPPGSDPDLGQRAAQVLGGWGQSNGDEALGKTWSRADMVPTGEVAAIALIERPWAEPLVASWPAR